jgi:hypothetical protein
LKDNQIEILEKEDSIDFNLIFNIDSEIFFVNLKIPQNENTIQFNGTNSLEEMSSTILLMMERIKKLEYKIEEIEFFQDSTIIRKNEVKMILNWIDEKYVKNKNIEIKLLYKGSLHGDGSAIFHKLCDNQGPTISIIETTSGRRFGGYTNSSWDSSSGYKQSDPTAFIFSLDRKRKFKIYSKSIKDAIFCSQTQNVTFGGGHDINVPDLFLTTAGYTIFPGSYGIDENFEYESESYLSGSSNFFAKDVEVYSVIKN